MGVVGLAVAGLTAWAQLRPRYPLCDEPSARRFPWSEDAAAGLEAGLTQAHPQEPERVALAYEAMRTQLNEYAQKWQTACATVCEDVGSLRDSGLEGRALSCLRRTRTAAAAMIDGWRGSAEIDLARASTAVDRLVDPQRCASAEALGTRVPLPDNQALRDRVEAIRDDVDLARGLIAMGAFAEALEISRRTLDDARASKHPPVIAEAAAAHGATLDHMGDYDAARDAMREAYFAARQGDHFELEALAAEQLTFIVGVRIEDFDEGLLWVDNAKVALYKTGGRRGQLLGNEASILDRKGAFEAAVSTYRFALEAMRQEQADPHAQGVTHMRLADALLAHGEHDEAIEHYRSTVALWHDAFGSDHPNLAVAHLSLATGLSAAGRNADAIAVFERAIKALSSALGEDHPNVGVAYINLGIALRRTGRLDEARNAQHRALEITRAAYGPKHRTTADRFDALGRTLAQLGRAGEAIERHTEAVEIYAATLEPGHPDLLLGMLNLAHARRQGGDLAAADTAYDDAWQHALHHAPGDLNERWTVAAYYGRALVEHGEAQLAIPVLETALERLDATTGPVKATAAFALARALWSDPAQRPRALRLAEGARGKLLGEADAQALERWLTHPCAPTR